MNISVIDKVKIYKCKQKVSLMPNLVHSLDSASMTFLYKDQIGNLNIERFKQLM